MLQKKIEKINSQNNFFFLTIALISLLISASLEKVIPHGFVQYTLEAFTVITFVVCLLSLRFDRLWFRFLSSLAGIWIMAMIARILLGIEEIEMIVDSINIPLIV